MVELDLIDDDDAVLTEVDKLFELVVTLVEVLEVVIGELVLDVVE